MMTTYDPDGLEYYVYLLGRAFYEIFRTCPKPVDTRNEVDVWDDLSSDKQRRLRRAHLHGYRDAKANQPAPHAE